MKRLTKRRPSLAFVLALVALVAAMGNGAYAVATAQKNSVVSKSIKNGHVKTPDLAPKAVSTAKLKDNAVTTAQLKDGAVDTAKLKDGTVTSAKVAAGAIEADDLDEGSVGSEALGGFGIFDSTSPATGDADGITNGGSHGIAEATATCPPGHKMISGGALWTAPSSPGTVDQNVYLQSSHVYGNGWRARGVVDFGAQGTIRLRTYVLCLTPLVGN
jgi:hypothetical protein